METVATCIEGLEFITQLEIKEILKKSSEVIIPSRVKFKVKDEKALAKFIFNSRSAIKVYELISNLEFKNLEDLIENIKKLKFKNIKSPFVVRCERIGEQNFKSLDIEKEVGEIILKQDKNLKVDLKEPETTIILDIINNTCFVGIDQTGIKLSKRDYRIRLTPNPINPCLAYAMLRIADINDKDSILDPFCKSGEIPIEAALYLNNIQPNKKNIDSILITKIVKTKPNFKIKEKKLKIYSIDESQNNLKSTQLNAKIAGINKSINFSRYEAEWLDTKFDKNSINKIITFLPFPTNNFPKEKIEKIYKEFFYQLEFILQKNGAVTILTPVPELIEKYAQIYKFKKIKDHKINYNKQEMHILKFEKQSF